jgi:O-antigen ligase
VSRADWRPDDAVRWTVLFLLVAAPLALGSVHPPAYLPLVAASLVLGVVSFARARRRRAGGHVVPPVPGTRLILAFHALVVLQLVPLPPFLLGVLSPGTARFHSEFSLVPDQGLHPVSVNPADTARGLLFVAAVASLYATVYRELGEGRWRLRLARAVVLTGAAMTLEALVQAATSGSRIYGLYRPDADWAVFGPYVNRNHFAGYVVMAIPLALGFTAEAARELRAAFQRRRAGWLAFGDPEGSQAVRRGAEAVVLIVGLAASRSRGGLLAFLVSLAALPRAFHRAWRGLLVITLVLLASAAFVDLGPLRRGFESRGIHASRLVLWADILPMVRSFPVLGCGLNAFATAYPRHQTVLRAEWVGQAHNEYLQALVDTGILGVGLLVALLFLVLRAAWLAAPRSPLDAGILGALLALAVHNLVDFNWQIPANAATYASLAALAVRRAAHVLTPPEAPSRLTSTRSTGT